MLALATAKGVESAELVLRMKASVVAPCHILVVDDEPLVCEAVRMLLSLDHHVVQTAGNAEEALALFEKGRFDIVMTDLVMPDMKGDVLALKIKAQDPKQPVVMITAHAESLPGMPQGVDFLVSKPFFLANLREAVAMVTRTKNDKKS
jgi:CheY-like chemotaxis protein